MEIAGAVESQLKDEYCLPEGLSCPQHAECVARLCGVCLPFTFGEPGSAACSVGTVGRRLLRRAVPRALAPAPLRPCVLTSARACVPHVCSVLAGARVCSHAHVHVWLVLAGARRVGGNPLLVGWEVGSCRGSGRIVYIDHNTHTTHWLRPSSAATPSNGDFIPLPNG